MGFFRSLVCTFLFGIASASAQYPAKPVTLVVPDAPGSAADAIGRALAQPLASALGQPVNVENRAGGGGNAGADAVAKSAPDGHTLLLGTLTSHAAMAGLESAPGRIHFEKDLAMISLVGSTPLVWVMNTQWRPKTMKMVLTYTKDNPGMFTHASPGALTPQGLCAEMLPRHARDEVDLVQVRYPGSAPAIASVLEGKVVTTCEAIPAVLPAIRSGKLIALAVTSSERNPQLPDVPTVAEVGVPGYEMGALYGVAVPAGTPRPVIDRLNAEIGKIVQRSEVREALQGGTTMASTPEQASERMRKETEKWTRALKGASIKLN